MPDLLVHILLPWLVMKSIQVVTGKPSDRAIVLVMVGAVLPDVVSVNYVTVSFGHDISDVVLPFHTPVGSVLFAAVLSLFFLRSSRVFGWMVVGSFTHYALDALIVHAAGGWSCCFRWRGSGTSSWGS